MLPPGDDVKQVSNFDLQPGLLAALAHRSLSRILVKLDEAGRESPRPLARVQSPADEEHLALALDKHACGNFWVTEDDHVTGGAETPHAPEGLPVIKRVTTTGTVV